MDRSRESRRTRLRPWVSVNFHHLRALESACLCLSFVASAPRNTTRFAHSASYPPRRLFCVVSLSMDSPGGLRKAFLTCCVTKGYHADGLQTLRELINGKCLASVIPSCRAVLSTYSVCFSAGIQGVENMYSDRYVAADIIPPCDLFACFASCSGLKVMLCSSFASSESDTLRRMCGLHRTGFQVPLAGIY